MRFRRKKFDLVIEHDGGNHHLNFQRTWLWDLVSSERMAIEEGLELWNHNHLSPKTSPAL